MIFFSLCNNFLVHIIKKNKQFSAKFYYQTFEMKPLLAFYDLPFAHYFTVKIVLTELYIYCIYIFCKILMLSFSFNFYMIKKRVTKTVLRCILLSRIRSITGKQRDPICLKQFVISLSYPYACLCTVSDICPSTLLLVFRKTCCT